MSALALVQEQNPNPRQVNNQANNDSQLLDMWLHGKSERTITAYKKQINTFLEYVGKPIQFITLADLQKFQDYLEGRELKPASQNAYLMTVKSLLSFAQKIGYIAFNPGAAIEGKKVKDKLAERILTESEVQAMIHLEPSPRNRVLLKFLYCTGARASEVSELKLRDFSECDGGAVVTLFGKGGDTRHVLIPDSVWEEIKGLHGEEIYPKKPLFVSRNKQRGLTANMIWHIVKGAAKRAGIQKAVSPHFMRHSCASHSLDRGAPIHVVQNTLGHSNLATTGKYTHVRPKESAGMYLPV